MEARAKHRLENQLQARPSRGYFRAAQKRFGLLMTSHAALHDEGRIDAKKTFCFLLPDEKSFKRLIQLSQQTYNWA